jgi:hypothetical protein
MRLYFRLFIMFVVLVFSYAAIGAERSPRNAGGAMQVASELGISGTSLEYIKAVIPLDNAVLKEYGEEMTFDVSIESVSTTTDERSYFGYDTEELVVYFNPFASDQPLLLRGEKKKTIVLIFSDKEQFAEYFPEILRSKIRVLENMRQWK